MKKYLLILYIFCFCFLSVSAQKSKVKKASDPPQKEEFNSVKSFENQDYLASDYEYVQTYGSIKDALKDPGSVKRIDLRKSALKDCPEELATLINLEFIDLSENQLSTLPAFFKNFKKLKELHLESNQFTQIPNVIFEIKSLEAFYIGSNKITSLPGGITGLNNLQKLFIQNNLITELPGNISDLKDLGYLYAYNNKLVKVPNSILNCEKLRVVLLHANDKNLEFPLALLTKKGLAYLSLLSNNNVALSTGAIVINDASSMNKVQANNEDVKSSGNAITSNIYGTSSTIFDTKYPQNFKYRSAGFKFALMFLSPYHPLLWTVSKKYRRNWRFSTIKNIEAKINKRERKVNPNKKRIAALEQKRLQEMNRAENNKFFGGPIIWFWVK